MLVTLQFSFQPFEQPMRDPEVIEDIPLVLQPSSKKIFVIHVPSDVALGESDVDFSNVVSKLMDLEGKILEAQPDVFIVPTGKLASLKGGFLYLSEARQILTQEDISKLAVQGAQNQLSKKRTGSRSIMACKGCT